MTVERDDGTVVNIYVHPHELAANDPLASSVVGRHTNVTDTKHEDWTPRRSW